MTNLLLIANDLISWNVFFTFEIWKNCKIWWIIFFWKKSIFLLKGILLKKWWVENIPVVASRLFFYYLQRWSILWVDRLVVLYRSKRFRYFRVWVDGNEKYYRASVPLACFPGWGSVCFTWKISFSVAKKPEILHCAEQILLDFESGFLKINEFTPWQPITPKRCLKAPLNFYIRFF